MPRVLLFTAGTEGDVRPFVRIGEALLARGYRVILITHSVFDQLALKAGLEFVAIDTPGEYERMAIEVQKELSSPTDLLRQYQEYNLSKYPLKYALIRDHHEPGNTLMLASINTHAMAQIAAEKLAIPLVTVALGPGIAALAVSRKRMTTGSILKPFIDSFRAEIGLPTADGYQPPQDVCSIAIWPDWFAPYNPPEAAEIVFAGFLTGGDPNESLPPEVESLLAAGPAPVLLTGGTGVFVGENYYTASIEACRRLGRRVILVARRQAGLPRPLPAEVSLFPALPFASLMPRMSAVIHHAGIGTTIQALAAGVPQLLLADGIDRPDNALRVERLGVGKFLPPKRWDPDSATKALAGLLDKPEIQACCRQVAHRTQEMDSLTLIGDTVDRLFSRIKDFPPASETMAGG